MSLEVDQFSMQDKLMDCMAGERFSDRGNLT